MVRQPTPSLRFLNARCSFGLRWASLAIAIIVVAQATARDTPIDPDDKAYLRRQFAWFQSLQPNRQQQLRQLNQEFNSLEPDERIRLTRVLQRYNAWLAKLPEGDRQRVVLADTPKQRLAAVLDLKEREWIASLPKVYRDEYALLDDKGKLQRIKEWRAEENDRKEEWSVAQKHWPDLQAGRMPAILEKKTDLEAFVANLKTHLSDAERKQLEDAKQAADEQGLHVWYAIEIVRLADLHPLLPGKPGPKNFDMLPPDVRRMLLDADPRHFGKKKGVPGEDLKELKRASGRWPDYAIELTRYCANSGGRLKLPPLGDCRKEQMPPEVQEFIKNKLEPGLRRQAGGAAQLEALRKAEGSWPEYPKMIVDLARQINEPIPNWTLPGPRQMWDRFRLAKNKLK